MGDGVILLLMSLNAKIKPPRIALYICHFVGSCPVEMTACKVFPKAMKPTIKHDAVILMMSLFFMVQVSSVRLRLLSVCLQH